MAEHPNVGRVRAIYEAFGGGDFAALADLLDEDITWHEAGRHRFSGTARGREAVFGLLSSLVQHTGGTLRMDVRKVFADNTDGIAVVAAGGEAGDRSMRDQVVVHLWTFRDGRAVAFDQAVGDQYTVDDFYGRVEDRSS